jgi:2',3'-cyclic-nucleotide 2'-phosphodiesterase (5'-nucleotidase family)
VVKEISGVRVGILGLTTPGIPNWENAPNYAGLEFREPVAQARKWVAELREKERVDIVVIAMHMGLEEDLRTGEINPSQVGNENRAVAIAREVPGIDVIFMGHTQRYAGNSAEWSPDDSGESLGSPPRSRRFLYAKGCRSLACLCQGGPHTSG